MIIDWEIRFMSRSDRNPVWIYACLLIALLCSSNHCTKVGQTKKIQVRLDSVVAEYVSENPGLLGAIVQVNVGSKEKYRTAGGFFDISRTISIRTTDRFLIGSITKVFTATLVHQLIENGSVLQVQPLLYYLPLEWADLLARTEYGGEITVAQALSHRTGLPHILSRVELAKYLLGDPSRAYTSMQAAELLREKRDTRFKPGQRFDYNNINYLLLSALIENVTGKTYDSALRDNILSPLSLDSTCISKGLMGSCGDNVAHGYEQIDGKLYDGQEFKSGWARGSGGIVSTTDDLITFLEALGSGELFKNDRTFRDMIQRPSGNVQYGLGMEVWEDPQIGVYYGHKGMFANTASILLHIPRLEISIATVQTFDGSTERRATDALAKEVLSGVFSIRMRAPEEDLTNILDYKELNLKIISINELDEYSLGAVTLTPGDLHKLVLVELVGRAPRDGGVRYVPSNIRIQYTADGNVATSDCLAIGHIFKTKSGKVEEDWLMREEEGRRTIEMSASEGREVQLFALFEVPAGSDGYHLLIQ